MEALYTKLEQLLDAAEHGSLSPKQFEQMNTTIKAMVKLGVDLPLRVMSLVEKFKGRDRMADAIKDMRAPMVRTFLGLPELAGR